MKKRLLTMFLALTVIMTVGVTGVIAKTSNDVTLQQEMQEEKFTGWFFNKDVNGWQKYNNGILNKNQFINDKGTIYYAKDDGTLALGWINTNNNWYYFAGDNVMVTGWRYINNKWYFFDSNGAMLSNTKVDGYTLGSDGAMQ